MKILVEFGKVLIFIYLVQILLFLRCFIFLCCYRLFPTGNRYYFTLSINLLSVRAERCFFNGAETGTMLETSRTKTTSIEAWKSKFSVFKPNFKFSPRPCLLIPQDQFPAVLYKYGATLCAEFNFFINTYKHNF